VPVFTKLIDTAPPGLGESVVNSVVVPASRLLKKPTLDAGHG
jgi:hypothetical protein